MRAKHYAIDICAKPARHEQHHGTQIRQLLAYSSAAPSCSATMRPSGTTLRPDTAYRWLRSASAKKPRPLRARAYLCVKDRHKWSDSCTWGAWSCCTHGAGGDTCRLQCFHDRSIHKRRAQETHADRVHAEQHAAHLWCGVVSIFCSSVPRSADQTQTMPSAPADTSTAAWPPRAVCARRKRFVRGVKDPWG